MQKLHLKTNFFNFSLKLYFETEVVYCVVGRYSNDAWFHLIINNILK